MAETTKIQWCDSAFNPWRGCTKISPGCTNCYAEAVSRRNQNVLGVWGPNGTRVLASEAMWKKPLAWERRAAASGQPWRVFCASLADVFEDWEGQMLDHHGALLWRDPRQDWPSPSGGDVPYTLAHARARLWRLIEATPRLTWQLLTKRPDNMEHMVPASWKLAWPANVWAMTSVEDQPSADTHIPELLKVPARVRGLSVEPLLKPVDLAPWLPNPRSNGTLAGYWYEKDPATPRIRWVIIGGESGPNARPCHLEWVRDLVRQCQEAGVACFVKQLGANVHWQGGAGIERHGRPNDPKGGNPAEWPKDLRVREFP